MKEKGLFKDFLGMMKNFVETNQDKRAFINLDLMEYFILWFEATDEETQIDFIKYALEYWKAYVMDVVNGDYKYITYTDMVWSSYMKKAIL